MSDGTPKVTGRVVRHSVDVPQSGAEHALARRRLVGAFSRPRMQRPSPRLALALAAALSVVVGLVAWSLLRSPQGDAVTYTVAAGSTVDDNGSYFAPVGDEPVVLRFEEGSRIQLEPDARARIARTTRHGASLLLEKGTARVQIVPRPGADWRVIAGPYSVLVRGTAFAVSWDADTGTFEVRMDRGEVLVRGPGIEGGVELSGTQHFVVRDPSRGPLADAADVVSSATAVRPPPAEADSNDTPPPAVERESGASKSAASRDVLARELPPAGDGQSWSQLAAAGQYRRVVEEAEARGVDTVLQSAGLAELWAFADAARITGHGGHARRALLAVRSRFPGSGRAASAAFLLGRMADSGGGAASAVQWYDRYLAEAPGGSFAPEAQGRRMVALKRSGNLEAARRAAQAYLDRFPNGPYAAVAREMAPR